MAVEILPTGGVFPTSYVHTVTLFTLETLYDYVLKGCFIFVYIMIVFIVIDDIVSAFLHQDNIPLWKSFRSYIDSAMLLVSFSLLCKLLDLPKNVISPQLGLGSLILYLMIPSIASKCMKTYTDDPNIYKNFGELHFYDRLFSNINALLLLTVYIRTFKYLSFIDTMHQFSITLYRSAVDLFWFAFLFLIMVFAYATSGVMLFGKVDRNFKNMQTALLTILRMLVSHIDYDSIKEANSTMSGVFVSSYIFLVFFFILVSLSAFA